MPQEVRISFFAGVPLLLELITLFFTVQVDAYLDKNYRRILRVIVYLAFSLIVQQFLASVVVSYLLNNAFKLFLAVYSYWVNPLIIVIFIYLTGKGRGMIPAWILLGVNFIIYATAFFSDIAIKINEDGTLQRGPLGFTSQVIVGLLILYLYVFSMSRREFGRNKSEAWIPVINTLIIAAALVMDIGNDLPLSFMTIAIVNSCIFYYIYLHLQFVREHEMAMEAEARMKIMISQIQPHFLYNTLSTIQALCRTDPVKASDITGKFGTYLRQNLKSLENEDLIPIENELEHTRIYAEIEMVRFPNIRVEYDIEDKDFLIPALTVQPMVENAIRYGVRSREEGIVTVRTRRLIRYHEIVIRDNGVGFDKKAAPSGDGTHIGIKNVTSRIENMCGGRLRIKSYIDVGTTVVITIPDNAEEHLSNMRKIGGGITDNESSMRR